MLIPVLGNTWHPKWQIYAKTETNRLAKKTCILPFKKINTSRTVHRLLSQS